MVAGIGVGSAGGAQREVVTIQVGEDENSWDPSEVAVQRGETVRWTWTNTSVPHNVVSAGGAWTYDSVYANSGDHSYTFPADGTYTFRCELHADMIGKVIVGTGVPTATATPTPTPDGNADGHDADRHRDSDAGHAGSDAGPSGGDADGDRRSRGDRDTDPDDAGHGQAGDPVRPYHHHEQGREGSLQAL